VQGAASALPTGPGLIHNPSFPSPQMRKPAETSGKPITLADVGRACGLAPSTVSNALNGTGTTSERTRRLVREAARRLGYRPNVHAATLAHSSRRWAGRTDLISVAILHTGEEKHLAHWTDRRWLEETPFGLEQFSFVLRNLDEVESPRKLSRQLRDRGVQGIVLSRMLREPDLRGFDWSMFSAVQEGSGFLSAWPFDQVRHSPASTLRALLRLAFERGYRRPGCALYQHPETIDDDEARLGEALAFNLLRVKERPVPPYTASFLDFESEERFVTHRSRLLAWYREHRPDCIVAFNTAPYYMLEYCGVDMAKEAGFLAYALSQYDARESCFSGFWAERFDVARECLERLLFLVTRSRKGVSEQRRTIIVDPVFNEGATLRATTSRRA